MCVVCDGQVTEKSGCPFFLFVFFSTPGSVMKTAGRAGVSTCVVDPVSATRCGLSYGRLRPVAGANTNCSGHLPGHKLAQILLLLLP